MPDFDGLKMVSIDVDKNITLAKQFGVMAVPSFVVFKEGAYVDKFTGFRNQAQLTEIFEKYIEIEATSREEAYAKAREAYFSGKVFSGEEYGEVTYSVYAKN